MKTISAKHSDIDRKWHIVDAEGKTLGRIATEIAMKLMGKHKPLYTPHIDLGDFVVVVNAEKVHLTGSKETDKKYFSHSGYFGSDKFISVEKVREKHPDRLISYAVSGMLPKNKMRDRRLTRLKVYAGPEHPHTAQQPEPINFK
ncbi:MAG: 50S ribosomal protein L13 [Candidatus Delongbacteria bacterium]|nr:50S ribosomal protein L13 [Candidatus Delongbacteria bacterium]